MTEMVGGIAVTQAEVGELSADQAKLVALAQTAAGRIQSPLGCAVLDDQGRAYTGATIQRGVLSLDGVQLALGTAAAAGADALTEVVVLSRLGTDGTEVTHFVQLLGEFIKPTVALLIGDEAGKISSALSLQVPQ